MKRRFSAIPADVAHFYPPSHNLLHKVRLIDHLVQLQHVLGRPRHAAGLGELVPVAFDRFSGLYINLHCTLSMLAITVHAFV